MWPPLTSLHQGERYTAQRMSNTPSMHTGAPVRWAFFLSTKLNTHTCMQSSRTSCFSGLWDYGAGKNKYKYKCSLLWNQIKFLIGQFCRWCHAAGELISTLSPPCCVPLSLDLWLGNQYCLQPSISQYLSQGLFSWSIHMCWRVRTMWVHSNSVLRPIEYKKSLFSYKQKNHPKWGQFEGLYLKSLYLINVQF